MHNPPHKPRICFVQLCALGLLDPGFKVPFGGAETRAVTFAKMLRDSGEFDITFSVLNETERAFPAGILQGMEVVRMPNHEFRETGIREPQLNYYRCLKADCFVSLGANEASHEMNRYARLLGTPTVVGLASDQSLRDLVFQGSMIPNEYTVPGFHPWEAMHKATRVLTQTQWQQERLYRQVGRRGILVRNPIPAGWEALEAAEQRATSFDFLWVGRPLPDKNPEIIFEAARELPQATFRMVVDGGPPAIREFWRHRLPANVIISDRLASHDELKALMQDCRAVLNSSPLEGFPNLMLQGAMAGCPSIYLTVDPDGWATEHGCAASALGDFDAFIRLLAKALETPDWIQGMASRARQRALACHAPEVVGAAFAKAIGEAIASRKNGKA